MCVCACAIYTGCFLNRQFLPVSLEKKINTTFCAGTVVCMAFSGSRWHLQCFPYAPVVFTGLSLVKRGERT